MPHPTARPPLRLHILSDLHLSLQGLEPPDVQADLTILAGDIARPRAAMEWAGRIPRPVLYVPGNHEFYGGTIPAVRAELAEQAQARGIELLDQRAVVIGGVRFLGATLWADFELFGAELRDLAMERSAEYLRDFQVIGNGDGTRFTPRDAAALFREQYDWLDAQLDAPHPGPTVVITHHAPNMRSVHPRFAESLVSASFVSECAGLLGRADLWIHGHTHDSFDYSVYGARVVCNPRGYYFNGTNENPDFDPGLCIDVPCRAEALQA
ncbi:Ser/Thr protein phosphatase family protein [Castellaniella defragrans 65Phen]|uniref:Ser/Thr protein phosphatase family protein n=2 Tax=Castellaniella defragrans TaxID=75697 RepID=W8X632_CASD6|nr:metallophosphoesterase [Castellaniella defragrans]MBB6083725.1 putative phosphodiesterase [Castellaniella defragrans]CDM25761.1 Ser/Thr protein phosphatase family protein [Castellaniella defragrans 65Phen]